MNKIDKLPDEYIDASIVATLLWDKIGEIIEWQNEMVELIKWSEVHMKPFTVEANTPQEPKIELDPLPDSIGEAFGEPHNTSFEDCIGDVLEGFMKEEFGILAAQRSIMALVDEYYGKEQDNDKN